MASRLSENPRFQVVLIEAGQDYRPEETPADLLDTYPGKALANPSYFWPDLRVYRNDSASAQGERPAPEKFEQARVIGGGSSINGQVALRGQARDFDAWAEAGCVGWDWDSVLPHFARLETDRDFRNNLHGADGPISIKRIPREYWDEFTLAVEDKWKRDGLPLKPDMNGQDGDGISPLPLSNDGERRASAALAYLTSSVRARKNLTIISNTRVTKLLFEGERVTGAEYVIDGRSDKITGNTFVLCCGAIFTPWLLMRSGVGPGADLVKHGIDVLIDRPVGANLLDHPSVSISTYLSPKARSRPILRHNYINGVYSSGLEGCPASDMVMSVVCRSAWHPIGQRLGTISCYVGKSFSRGSVKLSPEGPDAYPEVTFNWASDPRDLERLAAGMRRITAVLADPVMIGIASNPFASAFSDRVRSIGANSLVNRVLTRTAATIMDKSALGRKLLIDNFMAAGTSLHQLIADDERLKEHVRQTAWGLWHPSGTCRMGRATDSDSVVDPHGRLIGSRNLYVADASIFPEIPTYNINIPTIMVAEHVADMLKRKASS